MQFSKVLILLGAVHKEVLACSEGQVQVGLAEGPNAFCMLGGNLDAYITELNAVEEVAENECVETNNAGNCRTALSDAVDKLPLADSGDSDDGADDTPLTGKLNRLMTGLRGAEPEPIKIKALKALLDQFPAEIQAVEAAIDKAIAEASGAQDAREALDK